MLKGHLPRVIYHRVYSVYEDRSCICVANLVAVNFDSAVLEREVRRVAVRHGDAIHTGRCRATVAHARQSRPDSGLRFQAQVHKTFQDVPSSRFWRSRTALRRTSWRSTSMAPYLNARFDALPLANAGISYDISSGVATCFPYQLLLAGHINYY